MESNNDVLTDIGAPALPRTLHVVFAWLIFVSPMLVTVQSFKMFYSMFINPPPKFEKPIEEDSEFVQAPKKEITAEDKKEEHNGKKGKNKSKKD